tara:strand:- start:226 stop:438 length:213 start_codon:yes stop_codon:yes gene_type:complete
MNEEDKKIVWQLIIRKAETLIDKLPESIHHPNGRNAYAHVCSKIIERFGKSYKLIEKKKMNELKDFIKNV